MSGVTPDFNAQKIPVLPVFFVLFYRPEIWYNLAKRSFWL